MERQHCDFDRKCRKICLRWKKMGIVLGPSISTCGLFLYHLILTTRRGLLVYDGPCQNFHGGDNVPSFVSSNCQPQLLQSFDISWVISLTVWWEMPALADVDGYFISILNTTNICVIYSITSPPGIAVSAWSLYGGIFIYGIIIFVLLNTQSLKKYKCSARQSKDNNIGKITVVDPTDRPKSAILLV